MWVIALCFVCSGSYPAQAQTSRRPKEPPLPPLLPAEQAWLVTLAARPSAGAAMDRDRVYIPTRRRDASDTPVAPSPTDAVPADAPPDPTAADGPAARVQADVSADGVEEVPGEEGPPAAGAVNVTASDPDAAAIVALDRETGEPRWARPLESAWSPAVAGPLLLVVTSDAVHALEAATGNERWRAALPGPPSAAPRVSAGQVLVAVEPDALLAFRLADGTASWQQSLQHAAGPVSLVVEGDAAFLSLPGSRVVRVSGMDGRVVWSRVLAGTLAAPGLARDRVLVGSDDNTLYALDARTGGVRWAYRTGGDVIGTAALEDTVFAVSLDNVLRALNRGNGNQKWKRALTTRPPAPPEAFGGLVVVYGLSPAIAAFAGRDGTPNGMYDAPSELVGPALIDRSLPPFRVSLVAVTGDGRVVGLRPTGMMFREPPAAALTTLPGIALPREASPLADSAVAPR